MRTIEPGELPAGAVFARPRRIFRGRSGPRLSRLHFDRFVQRLVARRYGRNLNRPQAVAAALRVYREHMLRRLRRAG